MGNNWFSSDWHLGHKNIIEYSKRPFSSAEEMDATIIRNIISVVKPGDTLWFLGDFGMGNLDKLISYINRLPNYIYLNALKGNHDKELDKSKDYLVENGYFDNFYDSYKEIKIEGINVTLCHYSMKVWNKSHHGAFHLYGHCFDELTEIATSSGWKHFTELNIGDEVVSLNKESHFFEYNKINNIFIYDKKDEEMISVKTRNVDLLITKEHGLLERLKKSNTIKLFNAEEINTKVFRNFICAGYSENKGINFSDDHIRLLVWIATDGSLENKSLIRFHLKKDRKVKRIVALMDKLNIDYSFNIQKSGNVKINFNWVNNNLPFEGISLKPLDKLFLNANKQQTDIILEEYSNTDGCRTGDNTYQISTSKDIEANILQQLLVTNGYRCNLTKRPKKSTILSINENNLTSKFKPKNCVTREKYTGKVWCVSVDNGTLLVRRNGKVVVTQNSHGSLPDDPHSRSFDCGVDCHDHSVGWNKFTPISWDQVKKKMEKKEWLPIDHHTGTTKRWPGKRSIPDILREPEKYKEYLKYEKTRKEP